MNAGRLVLTASLTLLAACARGDKGFAYSGTLLAPSAAVGSTIGGRVSAVLVSDGAPVRAGDVLVRFDGAQERAALESARGKLAQARAALADLVAGPRSEDLARLQALAAQQRAAYDRVNLSTSHQIAALRAQVRQAGAQAVEAAAAAREAQRDAHRMRSLYATGDVSQQVRDATNARGPSAKRAGRRSRGARPTRERRESDAARR